MPIVKPFGHRPGHEPPPPEDEYRSDDCLWFFNAVPAYVAETGDLAFYDQVLPYADQGEATVLGHLRRALEFNLARTGRNGLPCGLAADWNDCLRLGYRGESLFVAFQVRLGLTSTRRSPSGWGGPRKRPGRWPSARGLDAAIQACAWDGDWFIWAIGEDGTVYGTHEYAEGQVYLNTQVWSVISGAATAEQAERCLDAVHERLATPYGLMLAAPALCRHADRRDARGGLQPGHQGERRHLQPHPGLGRDGRVPAGPRRPGLRILPGRHAGRLQRPRRDPPGANLMSRPDHLLALLAAGRQRRTSWLTGAAAWAYYSAVHAILGIQPQPDGLRIDPCIPGAWPGFTASRLFRGKRLEIEVRNPDGVCRGVRSLTLNGRPLPDGGALAFILAERSGRRT